MILLFLFLAISHSSGQVAEVQSVYGIGIRLCQLKCSESGGCLSIAYNIDELECQLSSKTATDWTEKEGYILYSKQGNQFQAGACSILNCTSNTRCVETRGGGPVCVDSKTVDDNTNRSVRGSVCRGESGCPIARKFRCSDRKCTCGIGYHYNHSNDSCVGRCSVYGHGYTEYIDAGIASHNDIHTQAKTWTECCELCTSEKSFTCITLEYSRVTGTCLLSQYGYLDVEPFDRQGTAAWTWNLGARNCA